MEKAEASLNLLRTQFGNPVTLDGNDFPDVWSAVDYVNAKAGEATCGQRGGPTTREWAKVKAELVNLQQAATKNHERLKRMLDHVKVMNTGLKSLDEKIDAVRAEMPASALAADSDDEYSLLEGHPLAGDKPLEPREASLTLVLDKIASLERQVQAVANSTDKIMVGEHSLDGPEDCQAFLDTKVPKKNFGDFLDLHSISELLFTPTSGTAKQMEPTSKLKLHSTREAVVIESQQQDIPSCFGSSMSTDPLNKLATYTKWDDATTTCLKHQFEVNLHNVKARVEASIRRHLKVAEAHQLATTFLNTAHALSLELYSFLSRTYLHYVGLSFGSKDAWELTRRLGLAVLTYTGEVRVDARDPEVDDNSSLAASVLWATCQCQVRMRELQQRWLEDHPLVAAELARFLGYSFGCCRREQVVYQRLEVGDEDNPSVNERR